MSLSLPTCTSLLVLALTILPAAVSAAVLPGVPKANLTVYHVNPMSFGGIPFNMDTGDDTGDLYFILRSVVSPIECAQNPEAEDCTDVEVISPSLVATKLEIEVDTRYGHYGMCNICTPALAKNSSMGKTCHPALYGKYVCCGFGINTNRVGFETVASHHSATCDSKSPAWECWRNHLVSKVGGNWWSFFNESFCGDNDVGTHGCAWKVKQVNKPINNTCLLDKVYTAIENYKPTQGCYSKCKPSSKGGGRNTSDPCWVTCTYEAVLGPDGGRYQGNITGMPVADIKVGWNQAYLPATQGGCPTLEIDL